MAQRSLSDADPGPVSGPDPAEAFATLVDLLRWRALYQPDQRTHTFLADGENEDGHLTHALLDLQARALAALLQGYRTAGERALLLYPPGLEFIAAFFGCLYAEVIAVPLPPPNLAQPQRTLPRFRAIIGNAQPTVVLTTSSLLAHTGALFALAPELQKLRWLATDQVDPALAQEWRPPPVTSERTALLQYTSGSTADPKGVVISHGNLLHNSDYISSLLALQPDSVTVSWLPTFHDMGLTNGIIQPVYHGRPCYLMPAVTMIMRPIRWLRAIARTRATISGGPNFAYEMCLRAITPEQRETLDLSHWAVAYNGAEPVRADTLKRFAAAFAPCGFRANAFHPVYGLAEATLLVSGGSLRERMFRTVDVAAFQQGRIVSAEAQSQPQVPPQPHQPQSVRTLVSSGHALPDTRIVITDPQTQTPCPPGRIGEIWVCGPSMTKGYWNRPEESEQLCQAYLKDSGDGPFLRTGDLGFISEGELFVTGRLKDLIIISGRKLSPQDLELTVEQCHPALRPDACAAFTVDDTDEERLIIVVEAELRYLPPKTQQPQGQPPERLPLDAPAVVRAIRRAVAEEHDVRVDTVVLLRAGRIPKTTSGKVRRHACRAGFLDGTLERLGEPASHD